MCAEYRRLRRRRHERVAKIRSNVYIMLTDKYSRAARNKSNGIMYAQSLEQYSTAAVLLGDIMASV